MLNNFVIITKVYIFFNKKQSSLVKRLIFSKAWKTNRALYKHKIHFNAIYKLKWRIYDENPLE